MWLIREYLVAITITGDVNLDDLVKVVSVRFLHGKGTVFPFLYSVRSAAYTQRRETHVYLLEGGVSQNLLT